MADNIAHATMLFYPLYYDIISLICLKITQAFHLLLVFVENSIVSWYFKIQNSVQIIRIMEIQIIEVLLYIEYLRHKNYKSAANNGQVVYCAA